MKYILTTLIALAFAATAQAGCGKKVASIGEIEKYDAATKALTIKVAQSSDAKEVEAKSAQLTMTPDSKVIAEGEVIAEDELEAGLKKLVGKQVTVVSEHGKIDHVISLVAAG